MTAPGAEAVKYSYDEAGRLTELKCGSQAVSFAYNEANLPTKTTLPDGIEVSRPGFHGEGAGVDQGVRRFSYLQAASLVGLICTA
jgi:hypothetical protein